MAVDGLKITLDEVKTTAGQVKTFNQSLTEKLFEIQKYMRALEENWQSDASESIRANFNALEPRFNEYRQVIDNYAKFLEDTVEFYHKAETQINNNANMFR